MTNKYYLVLVFAVALTLCWSSRAFPLDNDKIAHFAVAATTSQFLGQAVCKLTPHDKWACFFVPIILTGFGGFIWEFANYSGDSWNDQKATMAGAVTGSLLHMTFKF